MGADSCADCENPGSWETKPDAGIFGNIPGISKKSAGEGASWFRRVRQGGQGAGGRDRVRGGAKVGENPSERLV